MGRTGVPEINTSGKFLDQLRAEAYQAFDLGRLLVGVDINIEMHPILGDLAFRHALEIEAT